MLCKSIAAVLLTATLALGLTACVTATRTDPTTGTVSTVKTLDIPAVTNRIAVVVPPAIRLACAHDANAKPYFQQALVLMRAALNSGQYSPGLIRDSLSSISIRELRSEQAIVAEEAGLALYAAFAGQVVSQQMDQVTWCKPVLTSLVLAIESGLQ